MKKRGHSSDSEDASESKGDAPLVPVKKHQSRERSDDDGIVVMGKTSPSHSTGGGGSGGHVEADGTGHASSGLISLDVNPACVNVSTSIKLLLSNLAAGSVIGKGGEAISALRQSTRAKISLTESSPILPERTATIAGTHTQICEAFHSMFARMVQYEPEVVAASGQFTLKMMLSHSQVGCLIGKGGAAVQAVRDAAGVFVRVVSPQDMPTGSVERLATVTGPASSVEQAFRMIVALIVNSPAAVSIPTFAQSSAAMKSSSGGISTSGGSGHTSSAPHGVILMSPPKPTPHSLTTPTHSTPTHMSYAHYPTTVPTHPTPTLQYPTTSHPGYSQTLSLAHTVPPIVHHNPTIPFTALPTSTFTTTPTPTYTQNTPPPTTTTITPQFSLGIPSVTTSQFYIPDEHAGRVIGKAGGTVAEIRTLTGTTITISPKEASSPYRMVTISGTSDCVKLAQALVTLKMGSSSSVVSLLSAAYGLVQQQMAPPLGT